MSDYLWDKTGEPDPEVEQLEDVLGSLRYQPRKFELPHDVRMQSQPLRRVRWTVGLAAAAGLTLMLLAGLWFGMISRQDDAAELARREAAQSPTTLGKEEPSPSSEGLNRSEAQQGTPPREAIQEEKHAASDRPAAEVASSNTNAVAQEKKARAGTTRRAPAGSSRRERFDAGRYEERAPSQMASASRMPRRGIQTDVPPRVSREQQAAKEQVMLALRLTSAQLNIVQRKTQGAPAADGGNGHAPDEKNKIR